MGDEIEDQLDEYLGRENKPVKGRKPQQGDQQVVRVRLPRKGQLLGEVEQLLGDRRMKVRCTDGHTRLCRIPGKMRRRVWIKEGNVVLVQPWEVQSEERGDILFRYNNLQASWLEKNNYLEGIDPI
ncbi:MAG: translation initiation factor eIF-1A [Candidatus Altiarchaeales archaeon]|nr:translation initiation factor eIF-1A [Candidatus Altiarchaeales archaeon]